MYSVDTTRPNRGSGIETSCVQESLGREDLYWVQGGVCSNHLATIQLNMQVDCSTLCEKA